MSVSKLQKFLDRNPPQLDVRSDRTIIFVSDSKGLKLRDVAETPIEKSIVWYCRPGQNTRVSINYIVENLEPFIRRYTKVSIFLWTGTCDLTKKTGRFISLHEAPIDNVIEQYSRLVSLSNKYGDSVKFTILECPYYSIRIWNANKGYENPETLADSDSILRAKIDELNKGIHALNRELGTASPKLTLDMLKSRKSNKAYTTEKISYSLLSDGVHSTKVLNKYWLRRIIEYFVAEH